MRFNRRVSLWVMIAGMGATWWCASATWGLQEPKRPYNVRVAQEEPPQELSESIRKELTATSYQVVDGEGKIHCAIWLRKSLPLRPNAKPGVAIRYPFPYGELVGALRIPEEAEFEDFRRQPIEPGVYTLRYCLQIQDGNHVGTSPTRDFLTLQLASDDHDPTPLEEKKMMELSKNAAFSNHPAILYLLEPPEKLDQAPAMEWDAERQFAILVVKASTKGQGSSKPLGLRLVVVGHAKE
jgi:hypothetical protein